MSFSGPVISFIGPATSNLWTKKSILGTEKPNLGTEKRLFWLGPIGAFDDLPRLLTLFPHWIHGFLLRGIISFSG